MYIFRQKWEANIEELIKELGEGVGINWQGIIVCGKSNAEPVDLGFRKEGLLTL